MINFLSSAGMRMFSPKIRIFYYIKKYKYRLYFVWYIISYFFNFPWLFKDSLNTLALLKIKLFWKKVYDVIICVHDFTSKILSGDSNYILDVVKCAKFGDCSISMRCYRNLNFIKIWPEKTLFWGMVLVEVQWFGTYNRYSLEILRQHEKRVKNKSQKILTANSYVCRS